MCMWKNDGNHAGSSKKTQEQPEECSAGPGGLQAAARRRPCHPPAAQMRPTSTPEAAQEQAASDTVCVDFHMNLIRKSIEKEPGSLRHILY